MDMKRYFLYFITIAALTLAGCGGGGGGGGTNLTVGDQQATQELINALAARADITPAMVQELRDEIARLMAQPDMTPADVQALRDEIALLMMRATPEEVQELRDQIAMLSAMEPADVQALRDQIATLMMRATPEEVQALRDQIAMLEGRADITPAMVQALRDQIATLEGRADITPAMVQALRDQIAALSAGEPADVQALRDQIAMLEGRADITPAMVQALRDQIAMLEGRADITPAALQVLRADIARLTLLVEAGETRMEDPTAKAKAPAIADPDGDGVLGENSSTVAADDDIDNPMRPSKMDANAFAVVQGGIEVMATMSIGISSGLDRLGMPDAGVADDDEFAMTAEGTKDGFVRNSHNRTVDEVTTDEVTVFDNRDDPEDVAYRVFYDEDNDMDNTNRATLNNREAVTEISEAGVLTLDTNDVDGNHALFSAPALPKGEDQTYTYTDDDPSTMDVDEETRGGQDFRGDFNGVPGKFACTDGACTAGTDSMGRLDSLAGTWTFTPDDVDEDADPHMIADAKYDADYLAFGFWLRGTESRGSTKYSIGTFATGSMPFIVGNDQAGIPALVGTATYSGPAAGMFVMKTDIDGDNMGPVATEAGKFTADTTLEAKFGDETLTADDFTISGEVENFVLTNYDGTPVDNKWSLTLNSAAFAERTYDTSTGMVDDIDNHANTFSGTTTGVEKGTDGRWNGTFYGANVPDNDMTSTVDESETGYPTGVAGEFIGHFETGHAIGAYGAELDP